MCLERDKGRNVFGKGQRKECAPFLMWEGTCKAKEGKVFANVSAGVDRGNERCVRGARLRVVICVSLSTAAIALPPSTPMMLRLRLRATGGARMVREQQCQGALTKRRT